MAQNRRYTLTLTDNKTGQVRDFSEVVYNNNNLKGILFAYIGEEVLRERLESIEGVRSAEKIQDKELSKRADLEVDFEGNVSLIEVKSLVTDSIQKTNDGWTAKAKVAHGDSASRKLEDGTEVETRCCVRGEFDILAVSLFNLTEEFDFIFAKEVDLPSPDRMKGVDEEDLKHYIKSYISVSSDDLGIFNTNLTNVSNLLSVPYNQDVSETQI